MLTNHHVPFLTLKHLSCNIETAFSSDSTYVYTYFRLTTPSLLQIIFQVLYLFIIDTVDAGFMAAVVYDYLVAHFGE